MVDGERRQTAAGSASGVALDLLELLAAEASPDRMSDLVRRAAADADPSAAAELDRAHELALHVHSLFARRQQREAELAALIDTARDLTAPHELDTLLKMIVRRTRMLFGVDMSYISFRDRDSGEGYVRTSDGHASALTLGYRVPGDAGLGWESNVGGVPIWSSDYLADDRMRHSPCWTTSCVPRGCAASSPHRSPTAARPSARCTPPTAMCATSASATSRS